MDSGNRHGPSRPGALALAALLALLAGGADAQAGIRFCSRTALVQHDACHSEAADDRQTGRAICINLGDSEERNECFEEIAEEYAEAKELCRDQLDARRAFCDDFGEQRYDPDFDPALFDDDFDDLTNPNPYYPLDIGNEWVYEAPDETITVRVQDATKEIEGVTCIVVNDLVEEDGQPIEDTDDWYGQRLDGTVDYCGEIAQNFEIFEGDDPDDAELVDVDGSWKHGRDGAKAGTQFPANPVVGAVHRQEWAPGDAEDVAVVLATDYGYGDDPELDELVPQELAELLCDDDCVVTGEYTPVEPDVFERKYYAPGIGLFLEVDPEAGDIAQLVECNFDGRCAGLPTP